MKTFHTSLLAMILAALACGCSGSNYDADKCDRLITETNKMRNISDVPKKTWTDMYSQYMAINDELNDRLQKLIDTPWTDEKEKAVDEIFASKLYKQWVTMGNWTQALLFDEFAPSKYFSRKEIDLMVAATDITKSKVLHLKAQADID